MDSSVGTTSVDKALVILLALAEAGPKGMALGELAADLGLGKSGVHRLLATLKARHFVSQQMNTGQYTLGPESLRLADLYIHTDFRAAMQPALQAVTRAIGEIANLGVLDGSEVVYIDRAEPASSIRVEASVGTRLPAENTSLGRAMLAYLYDDDDAERFAADFTPRSAYQDPVEMRRIADAWNAIRQARANGYAVDLQENEVGIICIGVPILERDLPAAAVSVTMLAARIQEGVIPELGDRIRTVLSSRLPPPLTIPAPHGVVASSR